MIPTSLSKFCGKLYNNNKQHYQNVWNRRQGPLIHFLLIKHNEVHTTIQVSSISKMAFTSKLYSTESYSPGLCSWQRRNIFRYNKVDLDVLDSFLYKTIRRPEVGQGMLFALKNWGKCWKNRKIVRALKFVYKIFNFMLIWPLIGQFPKSLQLVSNK